MAEFPARCPFITDQAHKIAKHWSKMAITFDGALDALEAMGIPPEQARPEDLHAFDMIHMGGLSTTDALADLAGIADGDRVLDVGSGVGGPARRIARLFDASVCGIELSETLHATSVRLTDLVGLATKVRLVHGTALSLPFDEGEFEVVIMQHVAMQISEKDLLFLELARVLRQGGRLALHEIYAGEGELHYPLPWATEPSMSALEKIEACADRLSGLGFEVGEFTDQTEQGRRYHLANVDEFDAALARNQGTQGLSRDTVEARRAASVAMERNLRSGAIRIGMTVARKVLPVVPSRDVREPPPSLRSGTR